MVIIWWLIWLIMVIYNHHSTEANHSVGWSGMVRSFHFLVVNGHLEWEVGPLGHSRTGVEWSGMQSCMLLWNGDLESWVWPVWHSKTGVKSEAGEARSVSNNHLVVITGGLDWWSGIPRFSSNIATIHCDPRNPNHNQEATNIEGAQGKTKDSKLKTHFRHTDPLVARKHRHSAIGTTLKCRAARMPPCPPLWYWQESVLFTSWAPETGSWRDFRSVSG